MNKLIFLISNNPLCINTPHFSKANKINIKQTSIGILFLNKKISHQFVLNSQTNPRLLQSKTSFIYCKNDDIQQETIQNNL